MIARIKTGQGSQIYDEVDPACPSVIGFLGELLDDATPYAPASLRLAAFESVHRRQCPRCSKFSEAFAEWLAENEAERAEARHAELDHTIAEQRTLIRRLNGLDP